MENKRQRTVAENVAVSAHQSSRLFFSTPRKKEKKNLVRVSAQQGERKKEN
jgi:hypothetical protein